MFQYKRVNVENVVQFKRDTAAKKIILGWGGGCLPGVGEEDVGWWHGLILLALINLESLYLTAHSLNVWNYDTKMLSNFNLKSISIAL